MEGQKSWLDSYGWTSKGEREWVSHESWSVRGEDVARQAQVSVTQVLGWNSFPEHLCRAQNRTTGGKEQISHCLHKNIKIKHIPVFCSVCHTKWHPCPKFSHVSCYLVKPNQSGPLSWHQGTSTPNLSELKKGALRPAAPPNCGGGFLFLIIWD